MRVRQLSSLFVCLTVVGCIRPDDPGGGPEPKAKRAGALSAPIQNDFEDGTSQGWIPRGPVTLTNTDEAAFAGARSLKTTGRTAGFHGPSLPLTGQLAKGASYRVTVSARLVAGEAPTSMLVTMQRTLADGVTNQFDTVAFNGSVTDGAWVTLTNTYTFNTDVSALLLYVEASSATASYYIDSFSLTELAPAPLQSDFEDGTLQGWIARGGGVLLENTTEQAFAGTRSLKTSGRTAGFHGPSFPLTGRLTRGATYQVTVSTRLVAGQAPTTLRVTVQRTAPGGANAFDSVASSANDAVTDGAWVTLTGSYSFNADVSALLLYVEAVSATASYYIDSFSIQQVAAPPGPPDNTAGATATFETGTTEGWRSRTGVEVVSVTSADARGGTRSLLTTNRTATFRGPAFDVTNVMFNGSRYRIALWAKLAPGEAPAQLRVSLERRLGTLPATFHTVVPNTTVTADAWTLLSTTLDLTLANTTLTLYVETASSLASFYLDDFQITFIPPPVADPNLPSVYQTLAAFFPVGAAVWQGDLSGEHAINLRRHFNSLTSENDMKWSVLQPTEGTFNFGPADAQVAFAKANGMSVRGHTLVWHQQTPAWVFNDAAGAPMTPTPENRALLLQRMENHIRTVVAHFGADIVAWDVVNEAIDPGQPDGFRRSPWLDVIGPEYIDRAFQIAREVAPTAKLYLNDFGTTDPTKRAFLHGLVVGLRNRGIPVDGVGHQMHNNVDFPSGQAIVDTINLFDGLVEQSVTELDVSIYSGSFAGPVTDYLDIPEERLVLQGYRYRTFFQAFRQLQGKIALLTFWGQADDHTWLTTAGRVDAPLLFDRSLAPKHAYWGVVDPLQLPGADLAAGLSAQPVAVPVGEAVAFTITATNVADADTQPYQPSDDDLPAANVTVVSAVPPQTAFQSLSVPDGWSCTTPAVGGAGEIRCTTPILPPGGVGSFVMTVSVIGCAAASNHQITASATVSSSTRDPNPAPNNSAAIGIEARDVVAPALDLVDLTILLPGLEIVIDGRTLTVNGRRFPLPVGSFRLGGRTIAFDGASVTIDGRTFAVDGRTVVLLPAGSQYQTFAVSDLASSASDSCDPAIDPADVVITRVTSDEVENAPGNRDGNTSNDIVIGADCRTAQLRIERDNAGNGRVYTVELRLRDASGNTTTKSAKVIIPANQGAGATVDDGPRYLVSSACM